VEAYRAMRLRNLTGVEIDRHLVQAEARWTLSFPGTETKNHRLWVSDWPETLVPPLLRYLAIYRPLLLDGRHDGQALWISQRPGTLTDNGIYYAIATRTRAAFGRSVNPHLFRDAAATCIAVQCWATVRIARRRSITIRPDQSRPVSASTPFSRAAGCIVRGLNLARKTDPVT
jgi:hypothetical protein